MNQVTLTYLMKEYKHDSFKSAFIDLYKRVKKQEGLTAQIFETMWIEEEKNNPIFFFPAIERAHKENILTKDGKLTE